MPEPLRWLGRNQMKLKTKKTMKKTLIIASAALLFASCEKCHDYRIKTVKTYTNPSNGAWQKTETTIDEETVCGLTNREFGKYEEDLEGKTTANQGGSRVETVVTITKL
jgi:hypothetical protein